MSTNPKGGCGGAGGLDEGPGPRTWFGALLFPREPRSFPGRRVVKISLRAAHVLCSGVAVGTLWLDVADPLRSQWIASAAITGLAMLALDLHETGVFLVQARGLIVLIKVGLLGALRWLGPWQGWAMAALMVLSVISSHASSRFRYFVVFGRGGLKGAETKG
jgi:hypothetical protein